MGFKIQNISGTTIAMDSVQLRPGEIDYQYVIGPSVGRLQSAGFVSIDYVDLDPDNLGGGAGGGNDSAGNPLPSFSGRASSGTKNGDGNPLTIVYTDGVSKWTQTYVWTGTTAWTASKFVKAAV